MNVEHVQIQKNFERRYKWVVVVDQNIAWFSFVMGLISFGGFVLVLRGVVAKTPEAIAELAAVIAEDSEKADTDRREIMELLVAIEKISQNLKLQHDNADKSGDGINRKLDELSKDILRLRFKFEAYTDK